MPVYYEWTSRKKENTYKHTYPSFEVTNHPLKVNVVSVKPSTSNAFIDNLSKWSSAFEEVDPLLRFEQLEMANESLVDVVDLKANYTKAWNTRHSSILNKYTTGEKLTIVSSFLPGGEKTLIRQVSNLNEKVKHRLEQLDEFDEGSIRKTMGLSQQEYVTKINMLNDEIRKAWDSEQKVKAFKIGIQCSKLLSDVSVMQFYPTKFVLITDILDTFGSLVFNRLKSKSFGEKDKRTMHDIDPKDVPDSAKETCQNWLFKMASIRELLPRLYMEMTLLKCYVFINKNDIKPAIARITTMIRGMGNPLVAVYLRLYLTRVASQLLVKDCEEYFYANLKEFMEEYQQVFHPMMRKKYESQLLTLDRYLSLYVPAVDWFIYGTLNLNNIKYTLLDDLLQKIKEMENNELLLCCVISAFDSNSVVKKASDILSMIQGSADKMVMLNDILAALGEHMCSGGVQQYAPAESLVQTWWKLACSLKPATHFLQVLEPWLQFACTHLSTQHVNVILRGTIRYIIKSGRPADDFSGQIHFVIKRMLKAVPDVEEIFLMDAFMPLVDLVQTSNARTMMAKTVLSIFFSRYEPIVIEDHIVVGSLMRLCCILHDSINAVTVDDERKVCAELINKFIQAVDYHEDLELQLTFYVECRAAYIKLDAVLVALVQAVNKLAVRADSAEDKWLQRACAAYCFITVPSLHCTLAKLQLYLLSGQVALLNNCVGQAEANFKAFIGLIPDIPEFVMVDGQRQSTHTRVSGMMSDFLSTLLCLPDNVDAASKPYVLNGLIKTMERIHWTKTDPTYYTTLLRILDLLNELTQHDYCYHIHTVISNDQLYGSEPEFVDVLEKHNTRICQELLVVLKTLGEMKDTKQQHDLALDLFWRVATRADLNKAPMLSLAFNLWTLLQKVQNPNRSTEKSLLSKLRRRTDSGTCKLVQKLEKSVMSS